MRITRPQIGLFFTLSAALAVGCAADDESSPMSATDPDSGSSSEESGSESTGEPTGCAALELAGTWHETFPGGGGMQTHTIAESSWEQVSTFGTALYHIVQCDNAAGTIVAQGDSANEFSPDLYSKFEWTAADGGSFFYCQVAFDAATAEDASSAAAADRTDPANGGCATFPWSLLDPG